MLTLIGNIVEYQTVYNPSWRPTFDRWHRKLRDLATGATVMDRDKTASYVIFPLTNSAGSF